MRIAINDDRAPAIELFDARIDGLDAAALRARVREYEPGAGWVSRSYCFPLAMLAAHPDRVGIDIERVEACDERFARSIRTPDEQALAASGSDEDLISLWCSKEALAKALGDAVRYDPRRLESPLHWAAGACGPWRARPLPVPGGFRAWVCWREPQS
ncbi:MAG: 4'-phosphopantetheinyl transferase superfamily protein [Solirubrobacteraceae bacterium]